MKLISLVTLVAGLGAWAGVENKVALTPKNFRFTRPISTTANAPVFRVDLPEGVYAGAAHDDLRDIRVFNGAGTLVPASFQRTDREEVLQTETHLLKFYPVLGDAAKAYAGASRVAMTESADGQRSVVVQFGEKSKDGKAVARGYLVDLTAESKPQGLRRLELDWADSAPTGFFTMRAEGSDDLQSWRPLAEPTTLARFAFGGSNLERKSIELPDVRSKYVLLTWTEQQAPALKGLRGEFAQSAWIEPQRHATRVTVRREGTSEFLFEKMPVLADRLAVKLPEVNTIVRVSVSSRSDVKAPWQSRATATVYRIRVDEREVSSEPITFAPSPDRFWKLELLGADSSLGANLPEMEFHWVAHQLFFLAQGNGPFVLAYGQPQATAADFGVGSVTAALGGPETKVTPALASLGAEVAQETVAIAAPVDPTDASPGKKYALWALLVGGILLTSFMAWKLLRDLKAST